MVLSDIEYNYYKNQYERAKCNICSDGLNRINSISSLNITSKFATFDLGRIEEINFCPKCGRKLR